MRFMNLPQLHRDDQLRLLSVAVEQSPVSVVLTDLQGTIVYVNPRVVTLTGYERDELLGRNIRIMRSGFHSDDFYKGFWEVLLARGEWLGEFHNRRKDGRMFWERAHVSAIKDESGRVTHYLAVKEDITEKKIADEELRLAKERAEAAVKAKDAFLATMSHELRTPLSAINGVTQTLLEQGCPDDMRPSLELVNRAGQDLLSIIQEVLCLSGLQSGRLALVREPFDLPATIMNALQLVSELARDKAIAVDYLIGPSVPREWTGDALRFQQVLVNLLGNAVKFTHTGRVRLHVQAVIRPGLVKLRCWVSDTGIGIPSEAVQKLFQPFTQADDSITRRFGGTGLGLAISRSLARLMGGDVRIRSRIGKGTTFLFTTSMPSTACGVWWSAPTEGRPLQGLTCAVHDHSPVRRRFLERFFVSVGALQPELGGASDFTLDLSESPRCLISTRSPETTSILRWPVAPAELVARISRNRADGPPRPKAAAGPQPKLAERIPLRILIADDIRTNVETLRIMLRHLGYADIVMVDNGWKAVEATGKRSFDLIILDLHMPVMDGIAAAREIRLREDRAGPRAKIVALTASTLESDRLGCVEAGMDDFLTKPIVPAVLAAVIERLCGGSEGSVATTPRRLSTVGPEAKHDTPLLDEERLRLLESPDELGDPEAVDLVVRTVGADLSELLPRVELACRQRDAAVLVELVHGAKGAALTAGWAKLGERSTEVVAELRAARFDAWDTWPLEMKTLVEATRAAWARRQNLPQEAP